MPARTTSLALAVGCAGQGNLLPFVLKLLTTSVVSCWHGHTYSLRLLLPGDAKEETMTAVTGKSRKEGKTKSRATHMKEEMKKLRSNKMKERKRDNKPEHSEP